MRERATRRLTVMLVPHGSGSSRAVTVSHTFIRGLLGIGGVLMLTTVVLAVAAIARGVNIARHRGLEHENQVLVDEIRRERDQLLVLRDSLNRIGAREQQLRLLAGLNLLDTAVQAGGIGGPAGEWPERDTLLALGANGEQAFAARVDADALARRASILMRSVSQAYDSLSSHEARFAATPSIKPTQGRISSPFAAQRLDPVVHYIRAHQGIDVAAPLGSPITATAAGIVTDVRWEDGYGNLVAIDHGYGIVTRYAHCSKILVARGQHVRRGQKIALVGSTGESTGPHVHYEVWVNGRVVDPKTFVMPDDVITD
ncbi:MAG TPA: M23 family metallopeptidase [Gemmatimonadales bacterium]|nr:M23 family metallopeptidase [Gemmatimonadales bacterium]